MRDEPSNDPSPSALLARQPIFKGGGGAFGYELLYRGPSIPPAERASVSTARVLCDALASLGLDRVSSGMQLFINFDQELLEQGLAQVMPNGRSVVEVLEDVEATPPVLATLRRLRESGVRIALDDFAFQGTSHLLLPVADFVKVDVLAVAEDLPAVTKELLSFNLPLIAEKVETHEQKRQCEQMGYRYFQGFFFAKPEAIVHKHMAPNRIAVIQVLAELQQRERSPRQIAHAIGQDARLVHQILHLANSAIYRRRRAVASVADAVVVLGEQTLRRWASLLLLTRLADTKPKELLTVALTRGCLCEQFASESSARGADGAAAFTVGLLSVIDAILDRPMEDIVDELGLADGITAALLGNRATPLGAMLARVIAYEKGDWSNAIGSSGVGLGIFARIYRDAIEFANEAIRAP